MGYLKIDRVKGHLYARVVRTARVGPRTVTETLLQIGRIEVEDAEYLRTLLRGRRRSPPTDSRALEHPTG
jgi:hypothetical protein